MSAHASGHRRQGSTAGGEAQPAWVAVENYAGARLAPEDRASVIAFSDRAELLSQPTSDKEAAAATVSSIELSGRRTGFGPALKLAKKATGRNHLVAFHGSYHGDTHGSLSVTGREVYRRPFEPLLPGVTFLPFDDVGALDAIDERVAGVIVEPIQGEGGVRPISPATARAITDGCRRTGALLISDEIQSGSGRTGSFLRSGAIGLTPDLVALGKALGAGMPVGAALVSAKVASAIAAGDHGTTYGGNLLACRAALTFLEILDDALLASIRRVGEYLFGHLREIAAANPSLVSEVRGAGLIAGLDLRVDAAPVVQAALDRGLIVNRTSGTVVRLLPPYIVTERDVDEGMSILKEALHAAK